MEDDLHSDLKQIRERLDKLDDTMKKGAEKSPNLTIKLGENLASWL